MGDFAFKAQLFMDPTDELISAIEEMKTTSINRDTHAMVPKEVYSRVVAAAERLKGERVRLHDGTNVESKP